MAKVTQFPATETATQSPPASDQKVQKETILAYLKAYGYDKTLSEAEQNQFLQTALASDLNPFKREIHIAAYGEGENHKVSIITGYQIYLKRAERTGRLDGWKAWIEGTGSTMKAVVEIFRKDWTHSFTHEVYWEEAVQNKKDKSPTQFWAKQPRFQLRKVAIAQAFRLAFPDELGSLPYETAELPDNESAIPEVTANDKQAAVKTSIRQSEALAEEALDDDVPDWVKPEEPAVHDTATTSNGEQKPEADGDGNENLIEKIKSLFESHPEHFTRKHKEWILNTARKATDRSGVSKMVAYTEKVIRKTPA
jgi:phage recombination protein Bet